MGKAALDLPDPLQAPPEGPKASTDDLLSQLAGEEIDRLLAEADAEQPAVSRAPVHVGPPPQPDDSESTPPSNSPVAVPDAAPRPGSEASAKMAATGSAEVAAEMDALFSAAVAKDAEAAKAAAEADVAGPTEGAGEDVASKVVADAAVEAEAETTAAERAGLQVPAGVATIDSVLQAAAEGPGAAVDDDDAPLPFYLRPLEWLNLPLALLPENVRDFVGKAAIVTLFNAAIILAYVLLVRRGH